MSGGAKGSPRDRLRSRKKPFGQTVAVCLDADLAQERAEIEGELDELRERRDAQEKYGSGTVSAETLRELEDAQARYDEILPRVEETTERFRFDAIGRVRFEKLLNEHPPTDSQIEANKAKGDPAPEFNPDSFPPAICHATCVSHEWSIDDWKDLFVDESWNVAELTSLLNAAYSVNLSMRIVEAGKGSGGKRG